MQTKNTNIQTKIQTYKQKTNKANKQTKQTKEQTQDGHTN